jgi:hypothetical protein
MSSIVELSPEGQARLSREYESATLAECFVYHWFDLPDGSVISGVWDLRKRWHAYLGNYDFAGKTVFEVGPASGFLTFKMEGLGADVTCFDIAPGTSPDVMPLPGVDHYKTQREFAENHHSIRAAWWYFHRLFASRSKATYGNIYQIPEELGTYDVSVVGAVLLHLATPFAALTQIARRTKNTIIISDRYFPHLDGGPFMEINPHKGAFGPMAWWRISPQACIHMLHANGFEPRSVSYHQHNHHPTRDLKTFRTHEFFTVVADRLLGSGGGG